MTAENTRAALPGDLVAQLRAVRVTTPHGDGVPLLNAMAADALAARDTEIARLRAALEAYHEAAQYDALMSGPVFKCWNLSALDRARRMTEAALSPPPASDDTPPPPGWPTLENVR
jgi:hypothetical protein